MLEMMAQNVNNILTKDKVKTIIENQKLHDNKGFDIIALTSYLIVNNSALSTDVLISYFNTTNYEKISEIVSATNSLLMEYDVRLETDEVDQDYYSLRSKLFASYCNDILINDFARQYAEVIKNLIYNVSPFKIYKYYVFKRTAYDAGLFYKLYEDNANDIYKKIYSYDTTAYTLQQWALYRAKLKDFKQAFAYIDKAINMQKNNFSIKNTRAIILFEANKGMNTDIAIKGMNEAMEILKQCYSSDQRKVYHAQKYAEYAIHFAETIKEYKYLELANKWINDIVSSGDSTSLKTKALLDKLTKIHV